MRDLRVAPEGLATPEKHDRCSTRGKLDGARRHRFGNQLARIREHNFTALESHAHAVGIHCYPKFLSEQFCSRFLIPILPSHNAQKFSVPDEPRRTPIRNEVRNLLSHAGTKFRFRTQRELIAIAQGTAVPPAKMRA